MVVRGGGAADIQINHRRLNRLQTDLVIVHLLVDTSDAMGANLVNSMCEGVAALIEKICGGEAFMKILSNYYNHSVVRVNAFVPPEFLAGKGFSAEKVRDWIVMAGEFAGVDPHRAATHNKGIMNGIDAVALATGNDWRAIEAAAHAHASRESGYRSLTNWSIDPSGRLVGSLELPIKVGIVGGSLQSNPAVKTMLKILNVDSARELAEVMAAVGLAQNLAALRALVTEGIQQGHMTLHARSVAVSAGAHPEQTDQVVEKLIASGEIKVWKAQERLADLEGISDTTKKELDNVVRGAKDVDLANLEDAARKIALFEEQIVYHGLPEANIRGLAHCAEGECMTMGAKPEQLLEAIAEGITVFTGRSVEGPYAFVVGPKLWSLMSAHLQGYPVKMQAENILGGQVVLSPYLTGKYENEAFMLSQRGGDLEIILGQDMAVGYDSHSTDNVKLYYTESFTFRILEPAAVLHYNAT